ncbi:MAG: 1-deoxy-D-xylulose-5-phosphate reductoisomerase, partial [Clostridiales bacterium]|nr:1-deoxy-D-xylulose-5-phosphate reductoisomerase [Clostridiales bacterium]
VDSATLFNKSLEIAEASILFDIHVEKVSVVMHPESVIHAIVQYGDNSYKASMYYPDMSLPIEYALSYPERGTDTVLPLDFEKISRLNFYAPDTDRFPCLNVMPEALARGEGAAVAASSADEVLVDLYLKGKIGFYDIYDGLIKAVKAFEKHKINSVQDVFDIDKKVRKYIIS